MYSYDTSCMNREMIKTDGRDSAKCQKSKLGDIDGIIEFVLNDNKTKLCIVSSPTIEIRIQKCERGRRDAVANFCVLVRDIKLLSRFLANPTVENLRSKKESHSTRRGLRVGSSFKEFQQTP